MASTNNIFLIFFYLYVIFNYFLLLVFLDSTIFLLQCINDPLEICVLNIPGGCIICNHTYLLNLLLFCILLLDITFKIDFSYPFFLRHLIMFIFCNHVVRVIYGQDSIFFYINYIKMVKNRFIYNLFCCIIILHPFLNKKK